MASSIRACVRNATFQQKIGFLTDLDHEFSLIKANLTNLRCGKCVRAFERDI